MFALCLFVFVTVYSFIVFNSFSMSVEPLCFSPLRWEKPLHRQHQWNMAHLSSATNELVWFHICKMLLSQFFFFFSLFAIWAAKQHIWSTALWWKPFAYQRENAIWTLRQNKTIFWDLKCSGANFLCITTKWRHFLMLLCFMFVSSRETPACLAAPEVCTKCPTGAPHQAQGTSALSPLFSMTTQTLCTAALSESERNQNNIPVPPSPCRHHSVSLFISNKMFPASWFFCRDWTQAVGRIQCTSSFRPYESNETQSDSRVEINRVSRLPWLLNLLRCLGGHRPLVFLHTAPQKTKQHKHTNTGVQWRPMCTCTVSHLDCDMRFVSHSDAMNVSYFIPSNRSCTIEECRASKKQKTLCRSHYGEICINTAAINNTMQWRKIENLIFILKKNIKCKIFALKIVNFTYLQAIFISLSGHCSVFGRCWQKSCALFAWFFLKNFMNSVKMVQLSGAPLNSTSCKSFDLLVAYRRRQRVVSRCCWSDSDPLPRQFLDESLRHKPLTNPDCHSELLCERFCERDVT